MQLGAGGGSSYPHAIDTRQTWRNALAAAPDSDTRVDSEALNDLAHAIINLQTSLGAKPQGAYGSLAARLNQFLPGGGASPNVLAFSNTTHVVIPGLTHLLGTNAVLYQVYDAQIPALAMTPDTFQVETSPATYDVTLTFAQPQSGTVVLTAAPPVYVTGFTAVTTLLIPGNTHNLGTAALFVRIFDASNPTNEVRPQSVTVDPTTFEVVATFLQPQSGTLVLSAMGPRHTAFFTNQTAVTIFGSGHDLQSASLLYQCWDDGTPSNILRPQSVTVHPTTYDVTVTFGQPQSGRLILAAAQAHSGQEFEIRDAGITDTTAVRVRSQEGNLVFQVGDGRHATFMDQYGQAFLDITADLATGQYGLGLGMVANAFKLQLAVDSAAKPGTNTWTIASDERLKTAVEPFLDGLAQVRQLEPVSYEYNGLGGMPADGQRHVGFLAQALQAIAPYLLRSYKGQLTPDSPETDLLTYEGHALSFLLVNAIKELSGTVQDLQARCAVLEATVALLTPPEEPAA